MKLNNALRQVATTLKAYIDKVVPKKLSDLEIDMEIIGGNGASSWNDLEDKPFYAEETEIKETLFETQTVPFGIMGSILPDVTGTTILFTYDLSSYMSLLPDVTYTIVLDGEEYISKPKCAILYDEPCYYLGNSKFMGLEDTGEPFILTRMDGEFGQMDCAIGIENQSNGKELFIEMFGIFENVKKLDEKYIPDTIARKSDIPLTPVSSLITEKISNLTARADLKGVFTHKYQQLYIYNDTTYNMIQFLYGGLNGVIGIFGAGYVNIRVKSFTDADNLILEVRFSNGDYCYITVTDGVFNMIYKYYVYQDEILTKTNTVEYTPTSDYNPATKLYVDSLIPSDVDALALVTEVGFVEPAANNGYILTDAKGTIYTF